MGWRRLRAPFAVLHARPPRTLHRHQRPALWHRPRTTLLTTRLLRPRISSLADGGPSRSFSRAGFPASPHQPPSLLHLPSPALASLSQMWGEAHESAGAIIREPKAGGGPVAATAGMPKFVNLKGVAAALPIANVDTGGHIPLPSAPCPRPSPVFRRLPCSNAESAAVTAAPLGTNGRQVGRGGWSG